MVRRGRPRRVPHLRVAAVGVRESDWVANSEVGGTVPVREWIGDGATTSSH